MPFAEPVAGSRARGSAEGECCGVFAYSASGAVAPAPYSQSATGQPLYGGAEKEELCAAEG
ncbi:MAG: hypothetical protein LBU32_19770 [Clostridiales bacterium]|jgi:hypothetical protein|nr:hypothetical protein [Clostridiales bacterium]